MIQCREVFKHRVSDEETLSASWEYPAAYAYCSISMDWIQSHLIQPFIKQDSFKRNPTNPNGELVPQEKGLKTEGSASHSAFK